MIVTDVEFIMIASGLALVVGFIKGVVGFGMPMLLISGLSMIGPVDQALACLILPTLVTNGRQAMWQGWDGVRHVLRDYRVFLLCGAALMICSAQLLRVLPDQLMLFIIGTFIGVFVLSQLIGFRMTIAPKHERKAQAVYGSFSGFMGGISGVWGPPTVAMLTVQNTPKHDQVRILGVIFFAGSVLLFFSHIASGVLTPYRLVLSGMLAVPAFVGQTIGFLVLNRIDQAVFRKITLLVLLISAVNLLRRAYLI